MLFYSTDESRYRLYGDHCIYCGERAESDEHFPPKSYCNDGWILPACLECNAIAGTVFAKDFQKRSEYVTSQLKNRPPRGYSNIPLTIEEILEESKSRWIQILEKEKQNLRYRNRIAWNAKTYLCGIGGSNLFAHKNAKTNSTTINEPEPLKNQIDEEHLNTKPNYHTNKQKDYTEIDLKILKYIVECKESPILAHPLYDITNLALITIRKRLKVLGFRWKLNRIEIVNEARINKHKEKLK